MWFPISRKWFPIIARNETSTNELDTSRRVSQRKYFITKSQLTTDPQVTIPRVCCGSCLWSAWWWTSKLPSTEHYFSADGIPITISAWGEMSLWVGEMSLWVGSLYKECGGRTGGYTWYLGCGERWVTDSESVTGISWSYFWIHLVSLTIIQVLLCVLRLSLRVVLFCGDEGSTFFVLNILWHGICEVDILTCD